MTTLEHVQEMLNVEVYICKRLENEVTVDFPAVRAELRKECLEEVIKKIKGIPA